MTSANMHAPALPPKARGYRDDREKAVELLAWARQTLRAAHLPLVAVSAVGVLTSPGTWVAYIERVVEVF